MKLDKKFWQELPNKALPIIILGVSGFVAYAYCFNYCWQHVHQQQHHSRGVAAALIAVFCILFILSGISWLLTLIIGPGKVEKTDNKSLARVYICDPDGFPKWCSTCEQVKPNRAHHSTNTHYCVRHMDHYCAWLSVIVGQDNFKHFVQFVFYTVLLTTYGLATQLIYGHSRHTISAQMAVNYGIFAFWSVMLSAFLGVHIRYIYLNVSTIEWMDLRKENGMIFNIPMEDETRRVVIKWHRYDLDKFPTPFSQGFVKNWTSVMGPSLTYWLLPLPVTKYTRNEEDVFNEALLEEFRRRFREGKDGYLARTPADHYTSEKNVTNDTNIDRHSGEANYNDHDEHALLNDNGSVV